jgi:Na+-driven multidrug efflux pump
VQATFFLAATIAARLGTAALAAHAIVSQLWMLASFIVDGFAVAGTVLGSRLAAVLETSRTAAQVRKKCRCALFCCVGDLLMWLMNGSMRILQDFRVLTQRLMLLAVSVGIAAMLIFSTFESHLINLFTQDAETISILQRHLWTVLAVAQPINAAVFVLDGLLYATQSFPFVAGMMTAGFSLVFLPVLAWTQWKYHAVWGIWVAKVALNVGRLASACCWLHLRFLRTPADPASYPLY